MLQHRGVDLGRDISVRVVGLIAYGRHCDNNKAVRARMRVLKGYPEIQCISYIVTSNYFHQ